MTTMTKALGVIASPAVLWKTEMNQKRHFCKDLFNVYMCVCVRRGLGLNRRRPSSKLHAQNAWLLFFLGRQKVTLDKQGRGIGVRVSPLRLYSPARAR